MKSGSLQLGTVSGISVKMHWSVAVIAMLLAASLVFYTMWLPAYLLLLIGDVVGEVGEVALGVDEQRRAPERVVAPLARRPHRGHRDADHSRGTGRGDDASHLEYSGPGKEREPWRNLL